MEKMVKVIIAFLVVMLVLAPMAGCTTEETLTPVETTYIPHPLEGQTTCTMCHHEEAGDLAPPADHTGRTDDVCSTCHKPASEKPPIQVEIMTEMDIKFISITDKVATESKIEVTIQTLPGAWARLQPLNPVTGTRSSWPRPPESPKAQQADEQGLITWSWTLHQQTAKGEGILEIIATQNEDPAFLETFQKQNTFTYEEHLEMAQDAKTIMKEFPWTVSVSAY